MVRWLSQFDFVKAGLCGNVWLWLHILVGGLIALGLKYIWLGVKDQGLGVSEKILIVVITLSIQVIWEILENKIETPTDQAKEDIYGTVEAWYRDTLGDCLGVLIAAVLVVL